MTEQVDINEYLQSIAKDIVLKRNGDVAKGGPALDAQFFHETLVQSVELRRLLRDYQGQVAAHVLREHLWVFYPHMSFTDDYKGFRQFLASTGLGDSTVSELAALYYVIPLCDLHQLDIDSHISPRRWTVTREAIVALKRASKENSPRKVEQILAVLDKTRGAETTVARASIREKYRKQWETEKPGHGTTVRLPNGKEAVVVVFEDDTDLKKALIKLGSLTEWDLLHVKLEVR